MSQRQAFQPFLFLMRTIWVAVAAFVLVAPGGCSVDTDIPEGVLLSCFDGSHCPSGWRCDRATGLCLSPGMMSPVDPDLYSARRDFCTALWSAAQRCPGEMEEVLGDAAQVFDLPQDSFVHLCVTEMLADTTTADIFELRAGTLMMPVLSCDQLADLMCDMIDDPEEAPGC